MPNYGKYDTMDYKERFVKRQTDYIDRMFSRSDGYSKVGLIRRDLTTESDMPIHMFTTKSDGERKFVCHPEYPIYKGDIIDYVDGFKYLVTEQENHSTVENFGKAQKMEESISWKDSSGIVHTHSYYIIKGEIGTQDDNLRVPLSETRKQLWLQLNDETVTIYENQRFILGRLEPYKVTARDNFTTVGVLKLTLESDEVLVGKDDISNNIAYNGESTTTPVPATGVQFTKPKLEISKSTSESVSVYEYALGVPQSTVFTYRIDGIPASAYTITASTNNSITIKCNDYYHSGTLVAIKPSLSEYSIPLILKSLL